MSSTSSNPRRTPMTTRDPNAPSNGLSLKTSTLRKGATFHSPSSPCSGVSSLRRSQTTLDDVVDAYCRRAATTLDSIDQTLAGVASIASSSSLRDDSLPVPRGLLDVTLEDMMAKTSVHTDEDRRVLRPRSNRQPSDSGIGSSIVTTPQKRAASNPKKMGSTTKSTTTTVTSTINRSAAAAAEKQAGLSQKGSNRITEHILRPLLAKPSLTDFRPIVREVPRKIHKKEIVCLRDLEKTLLYRAPDKAKTASLYLEFCLTSLALIQTTVDQLSERDQTRATDRPYTNGYFIDLCDQVKHYASLLSAKEKGNDSGPAAFSITDEIKMYGGIAINGKPAELIRITRDGKAYSLRDGREVEDYTEERKEGVPMFKRSLSEAAEDEEEIRRSMARRKKNPTPEELAPKVCKHPGCDKQFARPCDLTKHEKTHSRPWKCPEPTCKYHEQGWPTEKEMDRHYNDKHAANPHFYHCKYSPCPYKSKRESNCKQHMEKAHGWKYDRTKNNGKRDSISKPSTSTKPTPIIASLPTPTSDQAFGQSPQAFPSNMGTMGQADPILIPPYPSNADFIGRWGEAPADLSLDMDLDLSPVADNGTPSTDLGSEPLFGLGGDLNINGGDDLYAAPMQMPPTPSDMGLKDFRSFNTPMFPTGSSLNLAVQNPLQQQQIPQQMAAPEPPHISPIGQGNTMLFTPSSMKEANQDFMDEGLGDCGEDFLLFPPSKAAPGGFDMNNNFFPDMSSSSPAFGQSSAQDFGLGLSQDLTATNLEALNQVSNSMDWSSMDFGFTQQ